MEAESTKTLQQSISRLIIKYWKASFLVSNFFCFVAASRRSCIVEGDLAAGALLRVLVSMCVNELDCLIWNDHDISTIKVHGAMYAMTKERLVSVE